MRELYTIHATGDATRFGQLLQAMQESAHEIKPPKRSIADALVELTLTRFRLGVTDTGETFAVELAGPAVAIMLKGGSTSLRAKLSKMYRETVGKTPNTSALGDAFIALQGMVADTQPEQVALRIAGFNDEIESKAEGAGEAGVVIDHGHTTGQTVIIEPEGWSITDTSPVLFRHTALIDPLPMPARIDNPMVLAELRQFLNVSDDTWPLVAGWLVASLIPNIPHPILMLGGEQGTGKSTAARMIVGLVDPSPVPLRSEPRDESAWAIMASASWVLAVDNVSRILAWWSDTLCKTVTGGGIVSRKLYTDSDLSVLFFKRCVILTSIDAGALRGDLGERVILVDLERISNCDRRTETELDQLYNTISPRLFAGLLSAVAHTLKALPKVSLITKPRMADFANVLAALDIACPELTGGRALELYLNQRIRVASEVIDGNPIALAIVGLRMNSMNSGLAPLAICTPSLPRPRNPRDGQSIVGHSSLSLSASCRHWLILDSK